MTVAEFIAALQKMPQDVDVFTEADGISEPTCYLNSSFHPEKNDAGAQWVLIR